MIENLRMVVEWFSCQGFFKRRCPLSKREADSNKELGAMQPSDDDTGE
jgi:hypothetical protein